MSVTRTRILVAVVVAACGGPAPPSDPPPAPDPAVAGSSEPAPPTPAPPAAGTVKPAPEPEPVRRPRRVVRSPRLAAAIVALPELGRVDGRPERPGQASRAAFVIRGELSARRTRAMVSLARAVVSDLTRRFVGAGPDADPHTAHPPVDVCLFEDDASYDAFVADNIGGDQSPLGFYLPRQRLVVANLGRSVGNLRHELVHPLVGDHFPGAPDWFNEGLGSLYGTARLVDDRRGQRFQLLVNYRLRHVRKAQKRGALPTLDDMATSGRDDVYGPRASVFYGTARYLLLYMDARGTLDAFYRDLRGGSGAEPTAARQLELLESYVDEAAFRRWLRRLRIGRAAPKPR